MTIQERIEAEYKVAFRAHEEAAVSSFRLMKSAITNAEIAQRKQLDDAGTIPVLLGLVKRHRDAIVQFQKGGRADLVAREQAQLAVVERYLPPQASDDDIRALVQGIVAALPEKSSKAIGQVMAQAMPKLQGTADGNRVRAIAQEELSRGREEAPNG